MYTTDFYFDYYSDEPPVYFTRKADEFDGYDPNGHVDDEEKSGQSQ